MQRLDAPHKLWDNDVTDVADGRGRARCDEQQHHRHVLEGAAQRQLCDRPLCIVGVFFDVCNRYPRMIA